ncbi:unnamed protein product [Notodromas monacha]|uniref:C2H2-type domain-containing protein n=1 Tax=Notodromas monacha TaxID=399045 RepID=A0A7R9BMB5_9CRUS|nr:unnamed protein product [Notodromas monacha]CAG0918132.1 unnamed protein product [Notodromas monacha]
MDGEVAESGEDVKVDLAGIQEQEIEADEGDEDAAYFVDETGQYYRIDSSTAALLEGNQSELEESIQLADGTQASILKGLDESTATGANNSNASGDSSEEATADDSREAGNDDDMNYVLIMDPSSNKSAATSRSPVRRSARAARPSVKKQESSNLGVYDFDEAEAEDAVPGMDDADDVEDGEEEDSKAPVKMDRRSAQNVSQHHTCNFCSYTTSKRLVLRHYIIERYIRTEFFRRYLLSRHLKTHCQERPHKCSVCERGFKTLASLQNHVNTHTGTKPHKCRYCEAAFTTSGELIRHIRYRHTLEKPHQCTECDYSSVELSKLKRHMRAHTGERPYQVIYYFTVQQILNLDLMSGNKPLYKCELCPASCGRKTDLRIHVQKLHMADRPLKCKRCGKTFPDRYSFKQHSKTHEGEKCFKCDLCNYASVSQRHLESHMLIHTNQKPYQCELCQQNFRQKQLLKRHLNLYHNPHYVPPAPKDKTHECPECQRSFRHKGNLIRHMASHDPDSSSQLKSQTLKLGRSRKFGLSGEEDMKPNLSRIKVENNGDMLEVEGKDGERFVVLEVIQMDDDQLGGPAVRGKPKKTTIFDADADDDEDDMDGGVEPEFRASGVRGAVKEEVEIEDEKADVSNCFGFDEEEDEDDEEDDEDDMGGD